MRPWASTLHDRPQQRPDQHLWCRLLRHARTLRRRTGRFATPATPASSPGRRRPAATLRPPHSGDTQRWRSGPQHFRQHQRRTLRPWNRPLIPVASLCWAWATTPWCSPAAAIARWRRPEPGPTSNWVSSGTSRPSSSAVDRDAGRAERTGADRRLLPPRQVRRPPNDAPSEGGLPGPFRVAGGPSRDTARTRTAATGGGGEEGILPRAGREIGGRSAQFEFCVHSAVRLDVTPRRVTGARSETARTGMATAQTRSPGLSRRCSLRARSAAAEAPYRPSMSLDRHPANCMRPPSEPCAASHSWAKVWRNRWG